MSQKKKSNYFGFDKAVSNMKKGIPVAKVSLPNVYLSLRNGESIVTVVITKVSMPFAYDGIFLMSEDYYLYKEEHEETQVQEEPRS